MDPGRWAVEHGNIIGEYTANILPCLDVLGGEHNQRASARSEPGSRNTLSASRRTDWKADGAGSANPEAFVWIYSERKKDVEQAKENGISNRN